MKTPFATLILIIAACTPMLATDWPAAAALNAQARVALDRGEFARAASIYQEILKAAPNDVAALSGVGVSHIYLDRLDLAKLEFEQALLQQPNDVYCLSSLGYIHIRLR